MSLWTHVIGSIRIDGLPKINEEVYNVGVVEAVLGPMSTFDEPNEECTLPMGSEGSLAYRVIEYDTGLPWIVIPIWGDLRDFGKKEDINRIVEWWHKLLDTFVKKQFMIRDVVLRIEDENGFKIVLNGDETE